MSNKTESSENPGRELADCVGRLEERQRGWDLPHVRIIRISTESLDVAIALRDDAMAAVTTLPLPSA